MFQILHFTCKYADAATNRKERKLRVDMGDSMVRKLNKIRGMMSTKGFY